jgi:hypothetical protein
MERIYQHQCLVYEGSPVHYLPELAAQIRQKLGNNIRCLYLNSPSMVAGMRSYLFAAGIDLEKEIDKGSLILTSGQQATGGSFDGKKMLTLLEDLVTQALADGYAGFWATGDMTWELGGDRDVSKLIEYEFELEKLMQRQPALSGICQYHVDTLPQNVVRQALTAHKSIYANETLARINPYYVEPEQFQTKGLVKLPNLRKIIAFIQRPAI